MERRNDGKMRILFKLFDKEAQKMSDHLSKDGDINWKKTFVEGRTVLEAWSDE